jgi:translation initiation factor RLI1
MRLEAAHTLSANLAPKIGIEVERAGQVDRYAAAIAEALRGSGLKYNDLAPPLARNVSPRELLEAVESHEFELIAKAVGISRDRAARVVDSLSNSSLSELATVTVEDDVHLKLFDGSEYKDIGDLSTGQRCTVILPMVLEHKDRIIIVDQPEDHLDNAFIADTLVKAVLERNDQSQMLFTTHNPNIPVLGNADRVIQMGSDGRRGFVLISAELEDKSAVQAITGIMEGGREAFRRRASFYARHKS